jgi:hypothetical protein
MKPPKTTKSPKNLKFHRLVVQLINTPRNSAAIDRLHEAAKDILGMVDGPMGCIKRETGVLGKYSTTCPPMHAKGCICVQCKQNDQVEARRQ